MSNINDIVKATGLSLGTISKYLNGQKIKEKNKVLIEQAINDLDYQVNVAARSLRTNRSYNIGIIIPNMSFKFFTDLIGRIEANLSKAGYFLSLLVLEDDNKLNLMKLSKFLNNHIDGLIVIPQNEDDILDYIMRKANMPIIIVDSYCSKYLNETQVLIDNYGSAYTAIEQEVKEGVRNIGIIAGDQRTDTAKQRLSGALEAIKKYKLKYSIVYGDYSLDSGYEACKQLVSLNNQYDCLFVSNYDMCVGVIAYLKKEYPLLLNQLKFISFDSKYLLDLLVDDIVAIEQPVNQMADYISNHILKLLNKKQNSEIKYFKCSIIGGKHNEKTRNIK